MDVNINVTLNGITNECPCGLRILYLTNCLKQLDNFYKVVDSTIYKDSLNNCLLSMVNFIEMGNVQSAVDEFNIDIGDIQIAKNQYFDAYSSYFYDMYIPPF